MADLYAKYTCTYCQEDIQGLRIKCVECSDFDLCLQCFSAGAEIGPHKNDHSYQFMDSGTISIFTGRGNWTAREHLRLLDAIEQFGYGNWEDISKHIETRTPEEAKEEYVARYLDGNIGKFTWPSTETYTPNLTDATNSDHGPLSPDLTSRLPPLDITTDEATQLGYMPQRDDFERDYNHEAESLVSSLFLNPAEDDDLDIALKLAQVDMYTSHLRERARRKRVLRDYQLVAQFFASQKEKKESSKKKQTKEEKDFRDRMRSFAQFYTAQEYEQFLASLEKERELRLRLSELYRYRENGVTRHEECTHFEQVMAQGQADAVDHWSERKSGSSGSSKAMHRQASRRRDEEKSYSSIDRKSTVKADSASNSSATTRMMTPTSHWEQDSNSNQYSIHSNSTSDRGNNSWNSGKSGNQVDNDTRDIESEASAHLLSSQEKLLCLQLDLKPTQYITQKTLLLQVNIFLFIQLTRRFRSIVILTMKTALALLLCLVAACAAEQKYTDRFDHIDVDNVLRNERLLKPYLNCLLHDQTCTADARTLKALLPDALTTNCEKCTEKQRVNARKVITHLSSKKPDVWNQVLAKFDPQNVYRTKYAKEARALGVQV
ncbi:transcriptional adapter 2B [Phymastichus coffea]|uniref:transcriptional adapter 2B n=1 Tax=Phymastichus coffea TaxID=108790 RepID=UPI00273AD13E|nr:transcriptional adapter 2B [Phymastichus coffea]